MGLDASCMVGYAVAFDYEKIDLSVIRKNLDLNDYPPHMKNEDGLPKSYAETYGEIIETYEQALHDEEGDADHYAFLNDIGLNYEEDPYSGSWSYVYVTVEQIVKSFPEKPMYQIRECAIELLHRFGVKNANSVEYKEFGYFS